MKLSKDDPLLSKESIERLLNEHGSLRAVARYIGSLGYEMYPAKVIRLANSYGIYRDRARVEDEEDQKPVAAGEIHSPDTKRQALPGKRYVFTSAQNNTYVHEGFYAALQNFCAYNEAELVISPFTYNKNGFQNNTVDDELWYDERLKAHFVNESVDVAHGLVFCGELDILPTASNPLSGFGNYTQNCSGIIPHVKMQMESMPRLKHEEPRFLYTTGTVTQRNYIQRKAGQKAEFNHVFGAMFVEVDDDGTWFARQLIADNEGKFYDLTDLYTEDGVIHEQAVEAINWGDVHIERIDQDIADVCWGGGDSIINVLRPKYQFIHDLTDFTVRNHHNINDPHFIAQMQHDYHGNVEQAFEEAGQFLDIITRGRTQTVVVESNHDLAYVKWLKFADVRMDPVNAAFFHESNAEVYKAIRKGEKDFNVYRWAMARYSSLKNITFLREDDSFVICDEDIHGNRMTGIECGMHGHLGPNGRRGAPNAFRNIGRKCNVGHVHAAGIIDGVYTAGVTCKIDMGYNKGPTSWNHSHILTYRNGKRAIITVKENKWRA